MASIVGKKYKNIQNGTIATVDSVNSRFKTLILLFDNNSSKSISTSTLAKYWVEVESDEIPKQDVMVELPKIDTSAVDVIKKVEKPKNNDVRISKSNMNLTSIIANTLIEKGYTPSVSEKYRYVGCNGFQFYSRNIKVHIYGKRLGEVDNKFFDKMCEDKMGKSIYVSGDMIIDFINTYF